MRDFYFGSGTHDRDAVVEAGVDIEATAPIIEREPRRPATRNDDLIAGRWHEAVVLERRDVEVAHAARTLGGNVERIAVG